jgi:hypothetical protein
MQEEYWPRVSQNWVERKVFGPKREEVIGDWKKVHNGELHCSYCSPKYC